MLSMPKVMLTDRFAAGAKPLNGDERTDFFDALVTGLCLRATKDRRSWSFCFTNPSDKKWTRLTLGTYPAISLAAARGKALEAKSQVDQGQDPRASSSAAASMTVAELVASYLGDPEKQALRSKASIERRLRKNVLAVIGEVKLSELRRRDVRQCGLNLDISIIRAGNRFGIPRWSAREWRLPGSRVKNGCAHVVPLSDLAIAVQRAARICPVATGICKGHEGWTVFAH
jgi:Arm DNA-binding domain